MNALAPFCRSGVSPVSFFLTFDRRLTACIGLTLCAGLAQAADVAQTPLTSVTAPTLQSGTPNLTRMCWNGDAEGQGSCTGALVVNVGTSPGRGASGDWACSRDNTTRLVWSLRSVAAKWEVAGAPSFADSGHNATARCGFASGWRLPTRSELANIVGPGRAAGPMLESIHFPRTVNEVYWSSDTFTTDPGYAWGVMYGYNGSVAYHRTFPTHVRLVHGAR